MAIIGFVRNIFLSGHERSLRAKKNILALFVLKGLSIVVSFTLIPLTLKLLDEYQYGVWITLFNVLSWISIFDIGIGGGLRNKFAEAIANDDIKEAREYVSTAYFLIAGISISLIVVFVLPWIMVDWSKVFNVRSDLGYDLFLLIGITFLFTNFQFCLNLIGTLLAANHKPSLSALLGVISNTLILLFLWLARDLVSNSLFAVGLVYTGVPVIVFLLSSIYFFSHKYKNVKPTLSLFNKSKVNNLFSLGIQFFVIQIAFVVIFTTDSMIISHALSPQEVTPYNIALRYFSVITMVVGIFMTPLWSAYTEAAAKNDFKWIKNIINKQLKAMILVAIAVSMMLLLAKTIIPIWIQKDIDLSWFLLISMAVFTVISVWNNIFSFLLNGLSITKVQTYTSILGTIINIPLSIYFAKIWGSGGIIFATCISLSFFAFFGARQAYSILKNY